MSSSGERGPSVGSLVRAREASKNPHLVWLVERAPSPRQTAIICQKLRLTDEEEKNAKALAWLKEYQPEQFKKTLNASEAENKIQEDGMKAEWGTKHYLGEVCRYEEKLYSKIIKIWEKLLADTELKIVEAKRTVWGLYVMPASKEVRVQADYEGFININHSAAGHTRMTPKWGYELFRKNRGWADLEVKVFDGKYLNLAKKFARIYQRRSKCIVKVTREY